MSDFYDLFKFAHVLSAMVWFGAGLFTQYVAARLFAARDDVALVWADTALASGNGFFARAAMSTLVFGVLTTIAGDISFGDLWITIGFVGVFVSIFTGAVLIGRATLGLREAIEADGVTSSAATAARTRLRTISAVDTVVLLVVVWAMVFKPGA